MRLLLVTFALRNTQKNYDEFFVALRGNVLQWWHFIFQTCVVATNFTVGDLSGKLLPHIDPTTDYILVTEIKPHEFQGWLPKEAWEWLNNVSQSIEPQKRFPSLTPPLKRIDS